MYSAPGYSSTLPKFDDQLIQINDRRKSIDDRRKETRSGGDRRKTQRFDRELRFTVDGKVTLENETISGPGKVLDLSLSGLRLHSELSLKVGESFHLTLDLGDQFAAPKIPAKTIWTNKSENTYGFRIDPSNPEWHKLITQLIDRTTQKVA